MILRKIFWKLGFKNESLYMFMAGFLIALAGIVIGKIIFSQNIGLVAVFLTALAAISLVDKQISISELLLGRTKRAGGKLLILDEIITVQHTVTLKSVYADHKNLFRTYLFLFLGIMLCYSSVIMVLPQEQVEKIFGEQFKIISGNALNPLQTFTEIIVNNFFVLLTGFFLALLFEFGTTFIIVWNASVWGTAFALAAKTPFLQLSENPLINFALIMAIVFPHLVLEIISYFASTIAGGLLNKALILEETWSTRFKIIATHSTLIFLFGLLVLGLAAIVETIVIIILE